jgi:hypothetical protein
VPLPGPITSLPIWALPFNVKKAADITTTEMKTNAIFLIGSSFQIFLQEILKM